MDEMVTRRLAGDRECWEELTKEITGSDIVRTDLPFSAGLSAHPITRLTIFSLKMPIVIC